MKHTTQTVETVAHQDSVESQTNVRVERIGSSVGTCNTCCRTAGNPWRVYDEHGKVTEGCVDDFHTGHLILISESNRWHNRLEAKAIRRSVAARKRQIAKACVTAMRNVLTKL